MRHLLLIIVLPFLSSLMFFCSTGASQENRREIIALDLLAQYMTAQVTDSNFKTKYSHFKKYEKAIRDPWSVQSPRIVKVGFDINKKKKFENMRRALHMSAHKGSPCQISFPLKEIEPDSSLSFSLGGLNLAKKSEKQKLYIEITDSEKKVTIYNSANSENTLRNKRWLDISIPLTDTDFNNPVISFTFQSPAKDPAHIFIANPKIFKKTDDLKTPPNVVYIVIDALRADAVDAIVNRYHITPRIDAIARDGLTFTNHFVVSNWTRPSTISMLTGCYASSTGINFYHPPVHDEGKNFFYKKGTIRSLGTILKKQGYLTRSIGNNSFLLDYSGIGADLDFDELSEFHTIREDTKHITSETISWLRTNRRRNFFLFINYNAPHNSYIPFSKYLDPLKQRIKNIHPWFRAYLGEVAYTDDYLGKVIDELKKLNLYHNTIIIVTSDHGEIFNEQHGVKSPYTYYDARFTHGQTQYDEELRVPLIIKPASGFPEKNFKSDTQVRSIDIVPTILELMNTKRPDFIQGRSLIPLVQGTEKKERIVYSEGRRMYSVRSAGYKYIERFMGFGLRPSHWGGDIVKEHYELYNVKTDPDELKNLYSSQSGRAIKMKKLLKKVRFQHPKNTIYSPGKTTSGQIRVVNGFFYDIQVSGTGSSIRKRSRKEYSFKLAEKGQIVYQAIPRYAKILIRLKGSEEVLCGKYLLPLGKKLSKNGFRLNPEHPSFHSEPESGIAMTAGNALRFWTIPSDQGVREIKKEKYLARGINRLLRQWGYIQGKEKKAQK